MGIDLQDTHAGIGPGMRANRPKRPCMFTSEGHQELSLSDVRLHKRLNRLDGRAIYPTLELYTGMRRNATPVAVGLALHSRRTTRPAGTLR